MNLHDACPKIYFGPGALESLAQLPEGRILLVCDPFMVKSGIVRRVTERLEQSGRQYALFAEVEPDPSISTVAGCLHALFCEKADILIALGGGSAIDTTKAAMFFCLRYKGMLMGRQYIHKPFFAAIPTTAGTGSEVTSYTVLTDREADVKIPLNDRCMTPDIAILDPAFTKSLPPPIIAFTGMDVLTHAIEAYVTENASLFTDMYATQAAKTALRHLPPLFAGSMADGDHQEMMLASTLAGLAFSNSGLGLCHGIAHTIGAEYGIPHGKANSIVLPWIIAFNAGIGRYRCSARQPTRERYAELARGLGAPAETDRAASWLVETVRDLNRAFGIAPSLSENGIERQRFTADLPDMIPKILRDITTGANPVKAGRQDIKLLLEDIFVGNNPLEPQ